MLVAHTVKVGTCSENSRRYRALDQFNLTQISCTIISVSAEITQALVTASIAVLAGLLVVSLARRQLLTFRFAAGWCLLFLLMACSGVLIPVLNPLATTLSTTPGVLVLAAALAVLVLICIQLSVSISGLQKQIQKLAEDSALQTAEAGLRDQDE